MGEALPLITVVVSIGYRGHVTTVTPIAIVITRCNSRRVSKKYTSRSRNTAMNFITRCYIRRVSEEAPETHPARTGPGGGQPDASAPGHVAARDDRRAAGNA